MVLSIPLTISSISGDVGYKSFGLFQNGSDLRFHGTLSIQSYGSVEAVDHDPELRVLNNSRGTCGDSALRVELFKVLSFSVNCLIQSSPSTAGDGPRRIPFNPTPELRVKGGGSAMCGTPRVKVGGGGGSPNSSSE